MVCGLKTNILSLVEQFNGTAGVVVWSSGEEIAVNEREIFPAASLIKLPILWELYARFQARNLRPNDEIILDEKTKVGGFGILKELHAGLALTLRDLAMLMIVLSDNTATNILIDLLGMDSVNRSCRRLGMEDTVLRRVMMDYESAKLGRDNLTTPRDVALFFRRLLEDSSMEEAFRKDMVDILLRQQCNNKLPFSLPPELPFAHKTGDIAGAEHDGGILFVDNVPVVAVVLTKELEDNKTGIEFHHKVGRFLACCALQKSARGANKEEKV